MNISEEAYARSPGSDISSQTSIALNLSSDGQEASAVKAASATFVFGGEATALISIMHQVFLWEKKQRVSREGLQKLYEHQQVFIVLLSSIKGLGCKQHQHLEQADCRKTRGDSEHHECQPEGSWSTMATRE